MDIVLFNDYILMTTESVLITYSFPQLNILGAKRIKNSLHPAFRDLSYANIDNIGMNIFHGFDRTINKDLISLVTNMGLLIYKFEKNTL